MKIAIATFIFTFFILSTISYSSEKDVGTITGKIVDNKTGNAIPLAIVALMSADSMIIASVPSEKDGSFEIIHVPFGEYNLKVSLTGYESKIIRDIEISAQRNNVKLETLILTEAAEFMLDEIKVTYERLKGEEKIDRTVFTINDDIRQTSSSGLDLLKHIPSVTVDFRENVTLEGRSDIQFYVDGVLRNKEFVAQLDPHEIDQVELITNPSVKYDSDISGVINIILKRTGTSGLKGSITIPAFNPNKALANPATNIEYGYNSVRLYAGERLHYERFDRNDHFISQWGGSSDDTLSFKKNTKGIIKFRSSYMNYGFDWFLNDKTALNFLGEWTSWKGSSKNNVIENRSYLNNSLDQYYKTHMNGVDGNDIHAFSMFFRRELEDEGCEFTAEALFNERTGETKNEYRDTYYNIEDLETITDTIARRDLTDNLRKTGQLKLDYSFITKNIKNEIGSRTFFRRTDNSFYRNKDLTSQDGEYVDYFSYDEWRQEAYYIASGKLDAISWQVGLAWDYSRMEIDGATDIVNSVFLPQVSLRRDLENEQNIKFSFRRKMKRPAYSDLNPFEIWIDSLHMRRGNSDLEPEMQNRFELTYSKNFKSNYLAPKLYFQYTDNAIHDVTFTRDDGVSVSTKDNVGKNIEYGFGFNTALQIRESWRLSGNLSVYNSKIDSSQGGTAGDKQGKVSYRINVTNNFLLPKDFSLYIITQYNSPYITYQRENRRDLLFAFGVGKKISEKASVNAFYVPFIKDFTYSESIVRSPGYYEKNTGSVYVKNIFLIEFKYNFGHGKKIRKIERTIEHEEDAEGGTL